MGDDGRLWAGFRVGIGHFPAGASNHLAHAEGVLPTRELAKAKGQVDA